MKKFLLSVLALGMASSAALANELTINFEGDGDLYGLTRQTATTGWTYVNELAFTEEGVQFSFAKNEDSNAANGYALVSVPDKPIKSGLLIGPGISPKITITVPGGKINSLKFTLGDYALSSMDMEINGTSVSSEADGSLYTWSWSAPEENAEGDEGTVTVNIPKTPLAMAMCTRYIHAIELSFTEDLGDKQECGLALSEKTAQGIMGQEFTAPVLSNPNNLAINWSSSNEEVATVDAEGKVTLVAGGKTTITAATEGNDEFAAGNVKYELTVVPSAANLVEMATMAPEINDPVYVNCPLTVTFANGSFAFVIDAEGNAGYVNDSRNDDKSQGAVQTIYKVGDVIPAGWIATNSSPYETVWKGLPAESTETAEVTYPEVASFTPEDVDKVVVLKDVTFETQTPIENSRAYGTTPDGTRYEFQNTYNIASELAGTYNVTGVVRYSHFGASTFFYMAPIKYEKPIESGVAEIETAEGNARYFNLQGVEVANPENGVFVKVADGKTSKVVVK